MINTDKKRNFKEQLEDVFGAEYVQKMGAYDELTLVEFEDVCDAWSSALIQMSEERDERMTPELEEVMLWCEEVWQSIDRVRRLLVKLDPECDTDSYVIAMGYECAGMRK